MFDWDAIVVGGGPAGLTAGLYLSRARIRTLLLEEESYGGKIKNLDLIENYPGFTGGIAGAKLANDMHDQAIEYGLTVEIGKVTALEIYSGSKCIICSDGKSYTTASIIIAGGSKPKKLGVPGENEFTGKGVFTCAFCDGGHFSNQTVVVCGGGDAGITEALYMTKIASKVVLIEAMPSLTASAILQERAQANPKMEIICGQRVNAITGNGNVEAVECISVSDNSQTTIPANGVLVHIGLDANTNYLADAIPLDKNGQIIVNEKMETDIPLVMAAGDVRSGSPGQISTAVGDGAQAAISAIKQLQDQ
jgi:thioredoxin reductase (NADPH)